MDDRLAAMDFEVTERLRAEVEQGYRRLMNGAEACAQCVLPLYELAQTRRSPGD